MADLKISALTASTTPLAGTEVLPIVQSSTTKQVSVANLTAGRSVSGTSFVPTGSTVPANGMYLPATNTVGWSLNSVKRMELGPDGNDLFLNFSGATLADAVQLFIGYTGTTSDFYVGAKNSGTLATKLKVAGLGDVTVSTGNLVIGTSGKGIDFSATSGSGTSELLADYEEGTFTPVVAGTGTAGTATYATQVGRYTKIGRMVSITLYVDWSGHTGTGSCVIQGLPFASAAVSGIQYSFTISDLNGYTLSALNVMLASMNSGAQQIGLQQTPVGGGAIASAIIDATASIAISGSYIV